MITLFRVINPHQRCLQAKVTQWNEPKQVKPKRVDMRRSLEIKVTRTFDTGCPTIFNKTYITIKACVCEEEDKDLALLHRLFY